MLANKRMRADDEDPAAEQVTAGMAEGGGLLQPDEPVQHVPGGAGGGPPVAGAEYPLQLFARKQGVRAGRGRAARGARGGRVGPAASARGRGNSRGRGTGRGRGAAAGGRGVRPRGRGRGAAGGRGAPAAEGGEAEAVLVQPAAPLRPRPKIKLIPLPPETFVPSTPTENMLHHNYKWMKNALAESEDKFAAVNGKFDTLRATVASYTTKNEEEKARLREVVNNLKKERRVVIQSHNRTRQSHLALVRDFTRVESEKGDLHIEVAGEKARADRACDLLSQVAATLQQGLQDLQREA